MGFYKSFKKIWTKRSYLRSICKTIYFNFHYLPFCQAIHLPILLYKPKFHKLGGTIQLKGNIKPGMIKLGFPTVSIYPNNGIVIDIHGGSIVFNGRCSIGNNSAISIGKGGCCKLGEDFMASTTLKLVCYYKITIGKGCLFGWDCMVMDTDFHKLTKINGGYSKGYATINIGAYNWFGNGCLVLKRSETPDYCVISARTVLSKKVEVPEFSVISQKRDVELVASGLWRNNDNDRIDYISGER